MCSCLRMFGLGVVVWFVLNVFYGCCDVFVIWFYMVVVWGWLMLVVVCFFVFFLIFVLVVVVCFLLLWECGVYEVGC